MSGKTALGIYHNRRFHAKSTLGNVAHSFTSPLQSAYVLSRHGLVGSSFFRHCLFINYLEIARFEVVVTIFRVMAIKVEIMTGRRVESVKV